MAWYRGSDDGDILPDIDLAKYDYLEVKFAHRDESEADITGVARVGATFQNRGRCKNYLKYRQNIENMEGTKH